MHRARKAQAGEGATRGLRALGSHQEQPGRAGRPGFRPPPQRTFAEAAWDRRGPPEEGCPFPCVWTLGM